MMDDLGGEKVPTCFFAQPVLTPAIIGFSVIQGAIQSAAGGDAVGHGVGITLLWIALILVAAKVSRLVERFGQPSVLGELVMGVILGNLSLVGIGFFEPIIDDPYVMFLAQLGVIVLLFQVGLETDIADMRQVGIPALLVGFIGIALPFVFGTYVIGPWFLPGETFNTYLFLGATLAATSVGITARVFRDLGRLQSPEAHIILGAAVIDDILALVILAVVTAIVSVGGVGIGEVVLIIVKSVLFLGATIFSGKYISKGLERLFAQPGANGGMRFTVAMSLGLLFAYVAEIIGLAPIIGAFAAGLILDPHQFRHSPENPEMVDEVENAIKQSGIPGVSAVIAPVREAIQKHNVRHIEEVIEPMSLFLVPVFFITTGMSVKLEALFNGQILLAALAVTLLAIFSKAAAGFAAGGKVNKWIVGWGMVPRGEVGLIFAMTGYNLEVMSDNILSAIIIMIIFTTLLPPPILSYLLKRDANRATV